MMSDVQQWDPSQAELSERHRDLLTKAVEALSDDDLPLSEEDLAVLRPIVQLSPKTWTNFVDSLDQETIVGWIRVLTVLEEKYSGFECGAKSPVIHLVKVLRKRNEYPQDLTDWIKRNSSNKFLPYGSLLDRL